MPRKSTGPRLRSATTATAAVAVATMLGALGVAGCSADPASARSGSTSGVPSGTSVVAASDRSGVVHLTAYTSNDGPTETVVVTGAIGDYGQAESVNPDGSVNPDHNSQLSLQLSHGTLRLDISALDKAFVTAMRTGFPSDTATCSGSVSATGQAPVVAGSGTGAYKGVDGSFTLTVTLDEVDAVSKAQPCNGSGAFLGQVIVTTGSGTVGLHG
jgi:hypothetical protein